MTSAPPPRRIRTEPPSADSVKATEDALLAQLKRTVEGAPKRVQDKLREALGTTAPTVNNSTTVASSPDVQEVRLVNRDATLESLWDSIVVGVTKQAFAAYAIRRFARLYFGIELGKWEAYRIASGVRTLAYLLNTNPISPQSKARTAELKRRLEGNGSILYKIGAKNSP